MGEEYLEYVMQFTDNVSPGLENISSTQSKLATTTEQAKVAIDRQNISFMTQQTIAIGLSRGYGQVNRSLQELGITSGIVADAMNRVENILDLVAGGFRMFSSAIRLVEMLKEAELGLAAVETYRAVLKNPAFAAVAIGAGVAAAGVGGYLLGQTNNQTTNNVTITATTPASARGIRDDTLEILGG